LHAILQRDSFADKDKVAVTAAAISIGDVSATSHDDLPVVFDPAPDANFIGP
jgi:hypothetical protein